MEITHLNYNDNCSSKIIKILELYKDELRSTSTITSTEKSLSYHDCLDNLKQLSSNHRLYIFAKKTKKSLKKLIDLKADDGEHILTIIGESSIVHTSKFSMMISEFLYKEAYLTKRQSQMYFTAVQETLLNAIEHGNLSLSDTKSACITEECWFDDYHAISKNALKDEKLGSTLIVFQCYLKGHSIVTRIIDEGKGFDTEHEAERESDCNLSHSRGIELVKHIADKLTYNSVGNCVEFEFHAQFLENSTPNNKINIEEMRTSASVLIVDDQLSNLKIVEFHLKSAGYTNIHFATSGEEAIEIASKLIPDLVILDIVMPGIDGFTTFRKIKQLEKCANIPILFFTGLDDTENRVRGYRLGAVDYVTKPIQRSELVARTNMHVQYSVMLKSLHKNLDRIHKDLNRAKISQLSLLPSKSDLEMIQMKHEIDVTSCFRTCDELAGDYWNILDIDADRVGIILADFTGHGVAASLNTVRLHSIVLESTKVYGNAEQFIHHINAKLKHLIPIEDFATCVYVIFNTSTGELTYIGCGNTPITIIPNDSAKECRYLPCEGIPLGIVDNTKLQLEVKHEKVAHGESLFLFSDALIETRHKDTNNMWGEAGLLNVLNDFNSKNKPSDLNDIVNSLNKTANLPLKDDLTLVHINYKKEVPNKELPHSYSSQSVLQKELTE